MHVLQHLQNQGRPVSRHEVVSKPPRPKPTKLLRCENGDCNRRGVPMVHALDKDTGGYRCNGCGRLEDKNGRHGFNPAGDGPVSSY